MTKAKKAKADPKDDAATQAETRAVAKTNDIWDATMKRFNAAEPAPDDAAEPTGGGFGYTEDVAAATTAPPREERGRTPAEHDGRLFGEEGADAFVCRANLDDATRAAVVAELERGRGRASGLFAPPRPADRPRFEMARVRVDDADFDARAAELSAGGWELVQAVPNERRARVGVAEPGVPPEVGVFPGWILFLRRLAP